VSFRGFGVEGRYLGSFQWQDQRATGPVTAVFSNPTINFGALPLAAQYASDFSSWEFNGFWQVIPRVRVFGGYRRFSVAESLAVNIGGLANFAVATQNRLSGLQGGIGLRVFDGADWSPTIAGVYADVTGRIGRYDNDDNMTTTTAGVGGASERSRQRPHPLDGDGARCDRRLPPVAERQRPCGLPLPETGWDGSGARKHQRREHYDRRRDDRAGRRHV
jgi:hypothetical protein